MDETHLWNKFRSGDRAAFEEIYRNEVELLLRYGRKFSNNDQLVEDCIQDLFVYLWQRRDHLGETDSVRKYLLVAIRRRIIKKLSTKKKRFSDREIDDYDFSAEINFEDEIISEEISREQRLFLSRAFDELSKRQKEVIYLKYYGGLNNKEIGEVMGINYQSVRNLTSRALAALREGFPALSILMLGLLRVF